MSAQNGRDGTYERHPETIRRAALRIAAEGDLTHDQISRRLKAEHGADVPRSTIAGWMRVDRGDQRRAARPPEDLRRAIGGQAARLLRLCDAEIGRLEGKRGPTDLDRIKDLSRILRDLEALKASTPPETRGKRARTLADLGTGERTETETNEDLTGE